MNALTRTSYTIIFITLLIICSDIYAIAGRVVYSYGDVQATANTGQTRQLLRGGTVDEGDSINTNNGRIQIRFSDGGFVALQPDTIYRLDEYEFQGEANGNEKSSFYLVEGGMLEIEAIKSATVVPAQLLNISEKLGTVESSKIADIIAVDGDPTQDIRSMLKVVFVMKNGKVYKTPS